MQRSPRRSAQVAGYSRRLSFRLNGELDQIDDPDPSLLLGDYLHDIGLTGTKVGCGQGGCGACTVMISRRDARGRRPRADQRLPAPARAVAGMSRHDGRGDRQRPATGSTRSSTGSPLGNGTQCGFCTPGFVMNAHAFLRNHPGPTEQEIEDIFGGNLCRCTGYRPILHAMRDVRLRPRPRRRSDPALRGRPVLPGAACGRPLDRSRSTACRDPAGPAAGPPLPPAGTATGSARPTWRRPTS